MDRHEADAAATRPAAPPPGPIGRVRRLTDGTWSRHTALAATLLLPPVLIYSRSLGDALLSLTALLFLAQRVTERDWRWMATPWTALALTFWAWQLAVTLAQGDGHQTIEAVVLLRLFVFAAAMETWVLADARARRWLGVVVLATALWIGIECWQQYLTGTNVFGVPRWGDGSLTGPFFTAQAGGTFMFLFFPAFLPWLSRRFASQQAADRWAGGAALVLLVSTQVLIGQRMPTLLLGFGLCLTALLLPGLRRPVAIAVAAGAVLAALTPILSPPTYAKLVVHFANQMDHFLATQYAQLFERATVMVVAHPWLGLGFDGFRDHCLDRIYWHNLPWFAVVDPASRLGCNIHPHNYYLQVATGAGLPGLALFVLLGIAWLWRLGRGAGVSARRVGLLVAAAITLWPIASTTSLFTLPNAGWVFLMIGWGLAEARAAAPLARG